MATQTIQFGFLTGKTVTVKLFADDGSDTVLATPITTEATNRTGIYSFTQTDRAAGTYLLTVSATGINAAYVVTLTLTTATFWAYEVGGGSGGSTVVVNPIALFAPGSTNDVMEIHQNETSSRGFLFYDVAANGAKTAKDFSDFSNLRWAFDLPTGTTWIETAEITVSDNMLTIPLADLSSDLGQFDSTLWDWAGDEPGDERTVVLCSQLLVNEAVGADDVV